MSNTVKKRWEANRIVVMLVMLMRESWIERHIEIVFYLHQYTVEDT